VDATRLGEVEVLLRRVASLDPPLLPVLESDDALHRSVVARATALVTARDRLLRRLTAATKSGEKEELEEALRLYAKQYAAAEGSAGGVAGAEEEAVSGAQDCLFQLCEDELTAAIQGQQRDAIEAALTALLGCPPTAASAGRRARAVAQAQATLRALRLTEQKRAEAAAHSDPDQESDDEPEEDEVKQEQPAPAPAVHHIEVAAPEHRRKRSRRAPKGKSSGAAPPVMQPVVVPLPDPGVWAVPAQAVLSVQLHSVLSLGTASSPALAEAALASLPPMRWPIGTAATVRSAYTGVDLRFVPLNSADSSGSSASDSVCPLSELVGLEPPASSGFEPVRAEGDVYAQALVWDGAYVSVSTSVRWRCTGGTSAGGGQLRVDALRAYVDSVWHAVHERVHERVRQCLTPLLSTATTASAAPSAASIRSVLQPTAAPYAVITLTQPSDVFSSALSSELDRLKRAFFPPSVSASAGAADVSCSVSYDANALVVAGPTATFSLLRDSSLTPYATAAPAVDEKQASVPLLPALELPFQLLSQLLSVERVVYNTHSTQALDNAARQHLQLYRSSLTPSLLATSPTEALFVQALSEAMRVTALRTSFDRVLQQPPQPSAPAPAAAPLPVSTPLAEPTQRATATTHATSAASPLTLRDEAGVQLSPITRSAASAVGSPARPGLVAEVSAVLERIPGPWLAALLVLVLLLLR
jgi:hypothetical protein